MSTAPFDTLVDTPPLGVPSYFVFLADPLDVLGVWVAESEAAARRLLLRLRLQYPNCESFLEHAYDFGALKARFSGHDFGGLEPEPADT